MSAQPLSALAWVKADYIEGRLITAIEGVGDRDTLRAAIDLRLKPKWKTYWRTPGDAGLPPETDWSKSTNVANATLLYPAPIRFQLFGLQTFGYADRVTFPVRIAVKNPGAPVALRLKLNVLVCSDVCVPQTLELTHDIPTGPPRPSDAVHLIQKSFAKVPPTGAQTSIEVTGVDYVSRGGEPALAVDIKSADAMGVIDVIPEVEPFAAFGPPVFTISPDQRSIRAVLRLAQPLPPGETLTGRPVTVTVTGDDTLGQFQTRIAEGGGSADDQSWSWLAMIGAALFGGLILNLMPCVLPVLSVKLLSVLKAQDKAQRDIRFAFLATAAGIIASLLVLALGLNALKATGQSVGWGIQFQQPLFIVSMAVLVTAFACNLFGLFEVNLPSRLSNWAGGDGTQSVTLVSHFLTGIFVTILATPCSAPFVGTAVGFGLASGAGVTLAIFSALGIGLALPYLVVALRPGLVQLMPKPGGWMIKLRVVLGFALLATAIWLVTVLAGQVGWALAAWVVLGLMLFVLALAARGRLNTVLPKGGFAILIVGLIAATLAAPVVQPATLATQNIEVRGPVAWTAFDQRKIKSLIAQGKTVFVDVTADWCITCKANKRLVIYQDAVAEKLRENVVAMQADWTSPEPEITAFLARFGRYGIPMNVVFGPGKPQGVVLPEILTADRVLKAIDAAKSRKQADRGTLH